MTWKDIIETYLPTDSDSTVEALRKKLKFERDVKSFRLTNKAFDEFYTLCEFLGIGYSPSDFMSVLKDLEILNSDFENILKGFEILVKEGLTFKTVKKQKHFGTTKFKKLATEIYANQLADIVKNIPIVKTHKPKIFFGDSKYLCLPHNETIELLKLFPYDRLKYIPEGRDCEDSGRLLKAWLAEIGIGNVTVGEMWATFKKTPTSNEINHAVNLVLYLNKNEIKHLIWEPQSEDVVYAEDKENYKKKRIGNIIPYYEIKPYLIIM